MPTRIDHAVTEVIPQPEAATPGPDAGDPRVAEEERTRRHLEELRRRELRTQAEGFSD